MKVLLKATTKLKNRSKVLLKVTTKLKNPWSSLPCPKIKLGKKLLRKRMSKLQRPSKASRKSLIRMITSQ